MTHLGAYPTDQAVDCPWPAAEAERWLVFLAHHLEQNLHNTTDLAWWELFRGAPRISARTVGLAIGVPIGLAGGLWSGLKIGLVTGLLLWIWIWIWIKLIAGPLHQLLTRRLLGHVDPFPRQIVRRRRPPLVRFVPGLLVGPFLVGLLFGVINTLTDTRACIAEIRGRTMKDPFHGRVWS